MIEYLQYFFVTLTLSTVFATAGLGSAVALVPSLHMLGLAFELSRVSGLFVNSVTTITTSILNLRKNLFDFKFVAPLVISSVICAYIGAQISLVIDVELVKKIFAYTLILIASMILFFKKPQKNLDRHSKAVLIFAGSVGGLMSGFLGIGGGSIITPLLFLFGYDAKKIAIGISFVIPFSSIVAFGSYSSQLELDYMLLAVVGTGAYLGGLLGNYILHFKISSESIKKILAVALYIVAFKMLFN